VAAEAVPFGSMEPHGATIVAAALIAILLSSEKFAEALHVVRSSAT